MELSKNDQLRDIKSIKLQINYILGAYLRLHINLSVIKGRIYKCSIFFTSKKTALATETENRCG